MMGIAIALLVLARVVRSSLNNVTLVLSMMYVATPESITGDVVPRGHVIQTVLTSRNKMIGFIEGKICICFWKVHKNKSKFDL
jgi:hypothetical protein